jgi:hypothetical protein
MTCAELELEIRNGKDIFSEIVRVTCDFLERFDSLNPDEIRAFEKKRRALLEDVLRFDQNLKENLSRGNNAHSIAMARQLEEFRIFQEVFLRIIMEKNAAIVSLATQSYEKLKIELENLGRGKQAIRGYNKIRRTPIESVSQSV